MSILPCLVALVAGLVGEAADVRSTLTVGVLNWAATRVVPKLCSCRVMCCVVTVVVTVFAQGVRLLVEVHLAPHFSRDGGILVAVLEHWVTVPHHEKVCALPYVVGAPWCSPSVRVSVCMCG